MSERSGQSLSSGLLLGGWLYQHWGPIEMFELQAAGIGGTCPRDLLCGGGFAPRAAEPAAAAARVGRGGGADAARLGQRIARLGVVNRERSLLAIHISATAL